MALTRQQSTLIAMTSAGGALEFYDFTIYALFSQYIAHNIFTHQTAIIGLISTLVVFALGYLARPLGGMFFGHIGDRYGRKKAFTAAIFMMAVSTLLIGCIPTYPAIGVGAPLLLLLFRLMQGFSVGGEIPGSTTFIVEHVSKEHRGSSVGLIFMFLTFGNALGSLVGYVLSRSLSHHAMMQWGWRLPFILGFGLSFLSYWLRRKAYETHLFVECKRKNKLYKKPLIELFKKHRGQVICASGLTALSAGAVFLFLSLPGYLAIVLHHKPSNSYLITTFSFLFMAVMTAVFGWLSDKLGRKLQIIVGSVLVLLLGYWLLSTFAFHHPHGIWFFCIAFAFIVAIVNGAYATAITELFPTNLRYSGMGVGYNIGFALFGGFGPVISSLIYTTTHLVAAPMIYVSFCAVITGIAALFIAKRAINFNLSN